jgi:hypothetical protein
VTRAEPVSALYEQGLIHHVGVFSALEQQMAEFTSDFDREVAGYSPDRVDALVWACTNLFVIGMAGEGLYNLYRQSAGKLAEVKMEGTPEEIREQLIAKGLISRR